MQKRKEKRFTMTEKVERPREIGEKMDSSLTRSSTTSKWRDAEDISDGRHCRERVRRLGGVVGAGEGGRQGQQWLGHGQNEQYGIWWEHSRSPLPAEGI
ncbi:hypothetical protein LWI29_011576 [Acer saccharum]|uniref:Uncharacterized protein n=1 Tax=Acer saccharum TaxID=4024 RepID=A0AA39SMH1_ACESA|nr:hypothetical protein LWI29_011576 [Acer saccharum]